MGLGSDSGPLVHRTLGWEHPARTPELCTRVSLSAGGEEDGAQRAELRAERLVG